MAAPLNTVLPTLDMGVTSWTGTVGSWDENGGGTVSYAWELRLVEDDSVVESGGGSLPQGTGTYNNANGYYLKVDATNNDGTTEARSKVGTLGIGLVGWWSASLADSPEDLSGNGNNGTYNGGMTTASDTREGGSRCYVAATKSTDTITGTLSSSLSPAPLTLTGWITVDDSTSDIYMRVFKSGSPFSEVKFNQDTSVGAIRVRGGVTKQFAGSAGVSDTFGNYPLDTWKHIAITVASTELELFIDGTSVSTSTYALTIDDLVDFSLFESAVGKGDDFRLYDRVLGQAEITELYTQGRGYDHRPKGLGDENLWYCPSILDSTTDLSGNGYNATYLGSTATTADTGAAGQLAYDCTSNGNTETRGLQGPSKRVDISDSYSFSWWYKLTDPYESSTNHYAFDCRAGNNTSNRSGFSAVHRGSKLSVGIQRGSSWFSGNGNVATGLLSTDLTDWHHFCTTFDHTTGELKCWVDGVNTGTNTASLTLPAVQPASPATTVGYLGNYISPAAIYTASGNLDDSRHFTRVLTEAEIKHLASGRGVTGSPVQGLGDEVAWYCPTLAGNPSDLSGNGGTGEYNGTAKVVEDVVDGGKSAYDLTGSGNTITGTRDVIDVTKATTISAWINIDAWETAFGKEFEIFSQAPLALQVIDTTFPDPQKSLALQVNRLGTNGLHSSGNLSISSAAGGWSHVCVVVPEGWDASALQPDFYFNGEFLAQGTASGAGTTSAASTSFLMGVTDHSQTRLVDDIRVFNRALTQDEIAHLASDRGVQGTPIVGLGDEQVWCCPSISSDFTDLSANKLTLDANGASITSVDGQDAMDTLSAGWLETGTVSDLNINTTDGMTVSVWVKADRDTLPSGSYVWALKATGQTTGQTLLRFLAGAGVGRLVPYWWDSAGQGTDSNWAPQFFNDNDDIWAHIAYTVKEGVDGVALYENGVFVDKADTSGLNIAQGTGTGVFGALDTTGSARMTAYFDDMRIFNRVLTQEEISYLASGRGALGSPPAGLGDEKAWYCPTLSGNASDLSGNGNTGEYQGGMGVTHDTDGTAAFEFDGVDDYIDCTSLLNDVKSLRDLSFSLWYKQKTTVQGPLFFGTRGGGTNGWYCDLSVTGGGAVRKAQIRSGGTIFASADNGPDDTEWHNIAFTVDSSGNGQWYFDGQALGTTLSVTEAGQTVTEFRIGSYESGPVTDAVYMDDIRFYSRVLTQAEITYLASRRGIEGGPDTPPPPTGTWHSPFRNSFFYNPFFDNEAL